MNLATSSISGRTTPDAPTFQVTGLTATSATLATAPTGLAVGDEVVLIAMRGGRSGTTLFTANVGNWELLRVQAISGSTVTLGSSLKRTYGQTSNTDLTNRVVVLSRVPQYNDLTIGGTGVLTTRTFQPALRPATNTINASIGGVLFARVAGTLTVQTGGRIDVSALGYRGGAHGVLSDQDSQQGEGLAGFGPEGLTGASGYNSTTTIWQANSGGGGSHITGGGGGYGSAGTDGASWDGGGAQPPRAGGVYGSTTLSLLLPGGGGGAVWNGGATCHTPGPGGNGGGILALFVRTATINGELRSLGQAAAHGANGSWAYGGAGGAGGSLWLSAESLNIAGRVLATGGAGLNPSI
ncbi:MAG: hypothetical protein ACK4N5_20555, partial [Myxococcales bacterium]